MKSLDNVKSQLKSYFNLQPYLEDEEQAMQSIRDGVSFRGPNILILIIAIVIASLGLNTNSAPVVIGAMLISPLMGPIIGVGLGVGIYDFALIKQSARNLAAAALFSILASTVYFLISPVSEGHSELLARTSPSIYDVLVALFGGGAGIVAIVCKDKGNVIPGVAIATALMPPLCTVGYGIATWQLQYAYGAFYLFVINSIFIALATLIGVKLLKFKKVRYLDPLRAKRVKRVVTTIVIATMLPSIYLTVLMLRESFFVNDANSFVETEFNFPNTQVFNKKAYIKRWHKYIDVTLIGERVNTDSLQMALTAKLNESSVLRGARLCITQGFSMGGDATPRPQQFGDVFTTVMTQIEGQRGQIDSLRSVIRQREDFDSLSYAVAPEIQVLYPEITHLGLSRNLVCDTRTRRVDTVNVALVESQGPLRDKAQIKRYLETRTGLKNLNIIQSTLDPAPEQ